MKFKKIMFVSILLLAILTIGVVSASEDVCDDNLAVSDDLNFKSSVDDSNERLETGVDSILMDKEVYDFKDLNDLINASAENSEVKLVKDYVYNASADEDYKNGINIAKTLTIDGQGHYIDGNFQARIFNVAGNDVTLKNIKLNNAGSKAFVVSGSNCRISGCEFVNCSCDDSTVNGGVISIGSGSIVNCSFTDCVPNVKKTVYGGALRVSGTDVVNCVFTNCSYGCDLVYGGAIYLNSGRIINCSFSHCGEACGSLYGSAIQGAGSIINCTFSNNSLSYSGDVHLTGVSNVTGSYFIDTPYGIRCNYGCIGNISNCTFERCSNSGVSFWCNGGNVTNCIFTDCHSQSAIYIHDSYVDVRGCKFDNCSSNGEGGAINIVERFDNIIDCTFVNCSSKNGGAIYAQDCNDTVTNCTFINCSADNGGAIYWNSANGKIDGSHFVKSRATAASSIYVSADNVTISNSRFESDVSYDIVYGGILINCTLNGNGPVRDPANDNTFYGLRDLILEMNPGDTLKLNNDYLKSEVFVKEGITVSKVLTIDGQGHKIDADAQGRIFNINANNVVIKNIEFINANYKAIVFSGTNCSIINCSFNNCTFIGDTVYGGVVTMNSGNIADCRFTNCSSSEWLTYGGVLSISDCNVTNCFFANCSQGQDSVYGGAIDMGSSNVVNCTFSHCGDSCGSINGGAIEGSGNVINCTFLDCACTEAFGGAIHFEGPSTLAGSTFINCYKAVVCQYGCIGNIYDCEFVNCSNYAMMFTARESNVTNCRFKNISSEYGVIYIHVSTYVNITGCEFTDCNAERGGAVYIELSSHNNRVEDCKFINCSSDGGAAIHIDCSNNTVKSCEFINCSARSSDYGTYGGGAIYVGDVANNAVINSTFINCAADNGGSVFWNGENGTLSDSNFENSTAKDNGGSVYWNGEKGKIINSNFMGSKAKNGGAVYFQNTGTVSNCNFTGNTATYTGGAVYFDSDGDVRNCNFTNNTANSEGGAIFFYSDSNGIVTKCNFINCSAELGKAIYANSNTLISSCNFETRGSERLSELVVGGIISNCTINGNKEKTATNMTIITEDITCGENATITVTMTTDGTVTININNQNIGLEITNGTGQITIPNLNVGEYIVKASFEGNSDYESANATTTLTVKSNMKTFEDITSLIGSAYAGDIINLEGTYYGTGLIITVNKELTISGDGETILDAKNLSGILSISANNVKISNIRFINGKINANGGAINWIGKNGTISNCTFINCSAENGGSVYWNGENGMINTSTFDKSTATSNGGAIYWNANSGEITDSIFTNSHAQNGGAVYVPENRNVEIKSSIFDSNIAEEESGAVYGGTVDDDCTFKNNTYTPLNSTTIISINETAVYTGNDISITTLILSQKGGLVNTGTVEIYINSKLIATIPANTAYIYKTGDLGTYHVLAKFNDDSSYKDSSSTAEFTVIPVDIPEEIETSTAGIFTLEFPDDAEGTLTVFIDGTKYKVYDIIGGILKIDLSDKKGKYNITFEYSGDKNYPAFKKDANVTVETNPSIIASNAKVLYSAGTTYKITVYKNKGITANSVSVVIKQNNKAFKTIKTNSKGIASFKVTQTPGTYKLKITSLGKTVTKTLTVKHIVTLKTATVKKSAKKLILQATLAKVNKKYLKKKTVTFKFNGKKYKAKTNAKGVAKVTIKKSVLKKLKVGKKITYQATYLKDTVKKTAKIKK